MLPQVSLDGSALMETGVITNDMNASVAAQGAAELIEVSEEGSGVSAFCPSCF